MTAIRSMLTAIALGALAVHPALSADDQPSEENIKGEAQHELTMAKKLIDAHEYSQAIERLKEARKSDADSADLHNYLGYAFRKMGEYDNSMASYDRALAIDPNHRGALEYKGELFLQLGKLDMAKEYETRLWEVCGNCPELNDLSQAIIDYQAKTKQ